MNGSDCAGALRGGIPSTPSESGASVRSCQNSIQEENTNQPVPPMNIQHNLTMTDLKPKNQIRSQLFKPTLRMAPLWIASILLSQLSLQAITYTWQGDDTNSYTRNSNWSPQGDPVSVDRILLPADADRFRLDLGGSDDVRELSGVEFVTDGSVGGGGYNWEFLDGTLQINGSDTIENQILWENTSGGNTVRVAGKLNFNASTSETGEYLDIYFAGGGGNTADGANTLILEDSFDGGGYLILDNTTDYNDTLQLNASNAFSGVIAINRVALHLNHLDALPHGQVFIAPTGSLTFIDQATVTLKADVNPNSSMGSVTIPTGKTLFMKADGGTYGVPSGGGTLTVQNASAPTHSYVNYRLEASNFTGTLNLQNTETRLSHIASFPNAKLSIASGSTLKCQTDTILYGLSGSGVLQIDSGKSVSIETGGLVVGNFNGRISGGDQTSKVIFNAGSAAEYRYQYDGTLSDSFAGEVQVDAALLKVGSNTFRDNTVTLLTSATLDIPTSGETVLGSLSSVQGFPLTSNLTIGGNDNDMVISGDFSGSGALTKNGSGTLTYTGSNSSTGKVTIAEGTLAGGSSHAGALQCNGTIALAISDNTPEQIDIGGLLTLSGATLEISATGSQSNDAIVLFSYGTLSGTFSTVTGIPSGYKLIYDYDNGSSANHIALVENTPPGITEGLRTTAQSPTNDNSLVFTITFNEPVFGLNDISDLKAASDMAADFDFVSGDVDIEHVDNQTYTITFNGVGGDGKFRFQIRGGQVADALGNLLGIFPTSPGLLFIDNTAPQCTIERNSSMTSPSNATSVVFDIRFTEEVVDVDSEDFMISFPGGSHGAATWDEAAGTLTVPVTGTGTLTVSLDTGLDISDLAGNALDASNGTSASVDIDPTAPTLESIQLAEGISDPTNLDTVTFEIEFSEPVSGVDSDGSDFTITYDGGSHGITAVNSVGNDKYSLSIEEVDGDGLLSVKLSSGASILDLAGNLIDASSLEASIRMDDVPPEATSISPVAGTSNPTNASTIKYDVTFSEDVTGFDVADDLRITTTGDTAYTSVTILAKNGSEQAYEVTFSGVSGTGSLAFKVDGSSDVQDLAGNSFIPAPLITPGDITVVNGHSVFSTNTYSNSDAYSVAEGDLLVWSVILKANSSSEVLDGTVSLSYGGQPLNKARSVNSYSSATGDTLFSAIFYLENPPAGTADFSLSLGVKPGSNAVTPTLVHAAHVISGVDLANPIKNKIQGPGLSTGITFDDVASGDYLIYAAAASLDLGTPSVLLDGVNYQASSRFFEIYQTSTIAIGSVSQEDAYSGLVNISHTNSTSDCAAMAVHFRALTNDPSRVYVDQTAPLIALNGSPLVEIQQGLPWEDPVTVSDDADSTPALTISGDTVDINSIGAYTVYYDATDTAGNAATQLSRTVRVIANTEYETWIALAGYTGDDALTTADPDNDGRSNLEEFAFDGNPASPVSDGKTKTGVLDAAPGVEIFYIILPVRTGASFSFSPEKTATIGALKYTIEAGTDLQAYDTEVFVVEDYDSGLQFPTASLNPGWEYRVFFIIKTLGEVEIPAAFMRARVEKTN